MSHLSFFWDDDLLTIWQKLPFFNDELAIGIPDVFV